MSENETKTNFNHSTNNGNKQSNLNNNNNQKKPFKYDYKLYFFITLGILIITIMYYSSITPETIVKNSYDDNQKTYKVVKNLKSILDGKEIKEETKK